MSSSPMSIRTEDIIDEFGDVHIQGNEYVQEEDFPNVFEDTEIKKENPPLDADVIERVIASESRQVLAQLPLNTASDASTRCAVFQSPVDFRFEKMEKQLNLVLAANDITVDKVDRRGKGIYNVWFKSTDDLELGYKTKFQFGAMVAKGKALTEFFRVSFYADELRGDHSERVLKAIALCLKVVVISVTINEKKRSATVYFYSMLNLSVSLSDERANYIKVPADGPLSPTFFLRINRCTATSSAAGFGKFLVANIPSGVSECAFLESLKEVLAPIIPRDNIVGFGIHRWADSGRSANFGFLFVLGEEAATLLEKVEIPVPNSKKPLHFQRALERPQMDSNPGGPHFSSGSRPEPHKHPRTQGNPGSSSNPNSNGNGYRSESDNKGKRKERDWE